MRNAELAAPCHKGCSPDNAACEGLFGRLKNEMYYHRDWINTTFEEFMQQVNSYIQWYNEQRIKISLGGLSPSEYRRNLGLQHSQSKNLSAPPNTLCYSFVHSRRNGKELEDSQSGTNK